MLIQFVHKLLILSSGLILCLFTDSCKKEYELCLHVEEESSFESQDEMPTAYPDQGEIVSYNLDGCNVSFRKVDSLYVYQGDIVYTESQLEDMVNKNGSPMPVREYWPNGIIYYKDFSDMPNNELIWTALNEYHTKTSIRFIERTNEPDYIRFIQAKKRTSGTHVRTLGMKGGMQRIYLEDGYTSGNVIHELGHVLGLIHEMCRSDRDFFVHVNMDNIACISRNQYDIERNSLNPVDFDHYSIMNYPSYDMVNTRYPDKPVMTSINLLPDNTNTWSKATVLSEKDVKAINLLYGYRPILVSPANNKVLDNGCYDRSDPETWRFDWADCSGAQKYNLYVTNSNSTIPVINIETTDSEYLYSRLAFVEEVNRYNWKWKVRSYYGYWGEWSEERTFEVEPLNSDCNNQTFTDNRDGHTYKWIPIGSQIWMAENLAYLPSVNLSTSVAPGTIPNYYVYDYTGTSVTDARNTDNYNKYGVLYNWPASLESCPDGWHLPSDEEWKQLEMYSGLSQSEADAFFWRGTDDGDKLKSEHGWNNDGNGTNVNRFSALPGGSYTGAGYFSNKGTVGVWASSTATGDGNSLIIRVLRDNYSSILRGEDARGNGFSVRCVKN